MITKRILATTTLLLSTAMPIFANEKDPAYLGYWVCRAATWDWDWDIVLFPTGEVYDYAQYGSNPENFGDIYFHRKSFASYWKLEGNDLIVSQPSRPKHVRFSTYETEVLEGHLVNAVYDWCTPEQESLDEKGEMSCGSKAGNTLGEVISCKRQSDERQMELLEQAKKHRKYLCEELMRTPPEYRTLAESKACKDFH